jgi:hypothetical protein
MMLIASAKRDVTASAATLSECSAIVIIKHVPRAFIGAASFQVAIRNNQREANDLVARGGFALSKRGQVAQVVERSPEKAGVGGSTPSLATIISQ